MAHPFRHNLEAALARIEQLESALADCQRPTSLPSQVWTRVRAPLMASMVVGSLLGGVGFSTLLVSNIDEDVEPDFGLAADLTEAHGGIPSVRTQIVTVSPRGISAMQVGDIASSKAAALNTACGGVTEPVGVTLNLEIAADGSVSRVEARAAGANQGTRAAGANQGTRAPDVLARCTERAAKTWTFPASDGATHATVPLYFRPNLAGGARPVGLPAAANAEPVEMGSLAVACMPACDTVLEDGVPLGRSPILAHPSTVGRHVIELISGTKRHTIYTDVYARQLAEIRKDLTDGTDLEPQAPL